MVEDDAGVTYKYFLNDADELFAQTRVGFRVGQQVKPYCHDL